MPLSGVFVTFPGGVITLEIATPFNREAGAYRSTALALLHIPVLT